MDFEKEAKDLISLAKSYHYDKAAEIIAIQLELIYELGCKQGLKDAKEIGLKAIREA